jgi:glycosyltransferase involved in cell wall biosynthesis
VSGRFGARNSSGWEEGAISMDDGVSVVVIVKNDLAVSTTIDALLEERARFGAPVELIVVDSSTDERVTGLSRRYRDSVLWIPFRNEEQPSSRSSTIPQQRNLGVRKARGEVVVFIDASCTPRSGWLAWLVGPVLNDAENITAGPALAVSSKDRLWTTRERPKSHNGREYVDNAPTINIAIRRHVFEAVGMFDEAFLYGSDIDFTARAVGKGYRIRFVREAVVVHDWGSLSAQMRRSWRYAEARVRFYKKHPGTMKKLLGSDFVTLAFPLFILMLPLTVVFPYFPLVLVIPLAKNMRCQPIKTLLMNLWWGVCVLVNLARFVSGVHE